MNEKELREYKQGFPESIEELNQIITDLTEREHEYGTCVYAMSIAAEAAFKFISHKLGATGFQASCADLDFLRRIRGMKHGFCVLDYENLLYPQYMDKFDKNYEDYVLENQPKLKERAIAKLKESPQAHESVLAHWKKLASFITDEPRVMDDSGGEINE